jgi:YHS domain-containing protein
MLFCPAIKNKLKRKHMKYSAMNAKQLRAKAQYMKALSENIIGALLKIIITVGVFLLMMTAAYSQKQEGTYFNNLNDKGVIIDGYDPVAFFTDNKPVKGDAQHQYSYEDAIYYFISQDHLELFKGNPEKYKVQFGGWCAYAVSLGRVAPIDVNTFSIVNARLVIQHNQRAVNGWNKDVQGNLALADKYWPKVSERGGRQIQTDAEKAFLNNIDKGGVILQGFDAVSYFTENKPQQGNSKYEARYNGATYWFSSEDHASMFKDHPEMFAPQYGAFCGYAMSLNKLRPIDPTIFQIVDGKLILQHTQDAYKQFNKDVPGNVAKANANWPGQVEKHAGKKIKFDKQAQAQPDDEVK